MFPHTSTDSESLPEAIKQLLYLPTKGPGRREPFCIICREEILHNQPSATHQCCGTTLCKKCFLSYILQKTWDNQTNVSLAADCPYCKRPILRPHPYAHEDVIMVAATIDLVRQCVGDHVFYCKPLNSRQQGDLLSDEQAMMMLDPQGKHPRAQQQYEEMKSHRAAGWRVFCFKEASPSTFLVAEGWKTTEQCASDQSNVHPALREREVTDEAQSGSGSSLFTNDVRMRSNSASNQDGSRQSQDSPCGAVRPGKFKRLWKATTVSRRGAMRADGWRLAFAGGC